jgi:hypothetical protein
MVFTVPISEMRPAELSRAVLTPRPGGYWP